MEFILRVQEHTDHEIQLQHKLSFSPLDGVDYQTGNNSDNIITVSADLNGFTTLNSICRTFNWNVDRVQVDVDGCNERNKSRFIQEVSPSFFMIPKSANSENIIDFPEYYISELCKVSDYYEVKTVHFTQYSFIEKFPRSEIISMLILLLNPVIVPRIERFYWEIDSRFIDEMRDVYAYIIGNIYRRTVALPEIVYAKKFKFIYDQGTYGNAEVGRFVEDI
ncbi:hypothetical protein G6663_00900 [Polynucleobacter paneuropaeus]|nr:hypothetical protein [Polynucleobacter paneuropaeus]MBT8612211.1 hypothetical protein [Polynucleobacter paneuropaeus]